MTDEPERANMRFSDPMKIRQPGASRALSSRRAISCAILKLVEQPPNAVQILRRSLVDQIGLAANDQHRPARMVLAPRGKARSDQLRRCRVDRFLALADLGAKPRLRLGERQARRGAR